MELSYLFPLYFCASTIVQPPLAFVRSGYIDLNDSKAYSIGSGGYGRSRTASSSASAYYLDLYPTGVNLSGSSTRWLAFPLR